MNWSVFCPYGNAYPKHTLPSIGLSLLSTLLIMAFAMAIYSLVEGNHNLTKNKKIVFILLGIFTVITFILNILLANW
jgi:hypothetical protein